MRSYTTIERLRINRRARQKLGIKKDAAEDRDAYMEACISSVLNESDAMDESDAEEICQSLWDEESDMGEFDDDTKG